MGIGERVRNSRINKGLTQVLFAKASGVSKSTILLCERGKRIPGPRILKKMADTLGVTVLYLRKGVE